MKNILLQCPKQKFVCLIAPEQILEYGVNRGMLFVRVNRFSHVAEYQIDYPAMLATVNKERGLKGLSPLPALTVEHLPLFVAVTEAAKVLVVVGEVGRQGGEPPARPGIPPMELPPGFGPQAPTPPQPPAL